jgi:hypothetical protein
MARNLRHNRFRLPLQRRSAGVARVSKVKCWQNDFHSDKARRRRFCSLGASRRKRFRHGANPVSGIDAPSDKRELRRCLFTAASALALRQNASCDSSSITKAAFAPGSSSSAEYRSAFTAQSEEKAAQASCQLESFLGTARKVHLSGMKPLERAPMKTDCLSTFGFCTGSETEPFAKMTFRFAPNGLPTRPYYARNGPVPKLRGERLDWELSCFRTIAERIGIPTFYGVHVRTGETRIWRRGPGRKPKRVPFAEIVDDGALIVTALNVDDHGDTWAPMINK